MNKKISFPIAIIIIVVCAVLLGVIIWQYKFIPDIDLFMESRYCKQDSDCIFTQCCGCASSCKKICSEEPKVLVCECVNNQCVPKTTEQVTITTDKTEYKQGEIIKIKVKNALGKPIWYLDAELGGWNPWLGLKKLEKGNWVEVKVHKPTNGECLIIVREQVPIEELIKELGTNAEKSDTWTLENCVEVSPIGPEINLKPLTLGTYRLFFNYGLSKEPFLTDNLFDIKTIYSNEFTIKEK